MNQQEKCDSVDIIFILSQQILIPTLASSLLSVLRIQWMLIVNNEMI